MKLKHKYAPQQWQDLMKPASAGARRVIERLFTEQDCASDGLILHDSFADGGTGKSTLVNMFATQFKGDVITLDPSGNKVSELADLSKSLTMSSGKYGFQIVPTLVLCHEISASPMTFINGLRDVMDQFSSTTLFLFTDNHYQKLVNSCPQMFANQRCVALDYDTVPVEEIRDYCYHILDEESKIRNFTNTLEQNKKIIDQLIMINKTSIRGIITGMENNCI